MNYVILREFLDNQTCNTIISNSIYLNTLNVCLNLLDSEDCTNIWYKSIRSPGLEYRYQRDVSTDLLQLNIKKELSSITGIDFSGGINDRCLPMCRYSNEGSIKVHRDIDKANNLNKAIEYVVVCMLTQVGKDFNSDADEPMDNLYINFDKFGIHGDSSLVSKDGKEVIEATITQRVYPNLQKGDVIIFRNDNSVHGVHPILVKEGQLGRITCGFRSK